MLMLFPFAVHNTALPQPPPSHGRCKKCPRCILIMILLSGAVFINTNHQTLETGNKICLGRFISKYLGIICFTKCTVNIL